MDQAQAFYKFLLLCQKMLRRYHVLTMSLITNGKNISLQEFSSYTANLAIMGLDNELKENC